MTASGGTFRGVRRRVVADPLVPDADAPPPLPVGDAPVDDLAGWAREHRDTIDTMLAVHGALLLRSAIRGVAAFGEIAEALVGRPAPYRERSSPRSELRPGVYTSTDHPADQRIALHNENSYQRSYPARLVFGCLRPADHGGATPLADCREVLAAVDGAVRARFDATGVRYVRHFGLGAGLSWQEAFGTTERDRVEEYCADRGITTAWADDGVLRTEQRGPATVRHGTDGAEVWFNHAAFFHPSGLDPALRAALALQFGGRLPADVTYGDGEPIDDATAAHLRAAYTAGTRSRSWCAGDVLLLDNVLVAHGREPFSGVREVVVSMSAEITPMR